MVPKYLPHRSVKRLINLCYVAAVAAQRHIRCHMIKRLWVRISRDGGLLNIFVSFLKIAQAEGQTRDMFPFIFSSKQRLRLLGYCATYIFTSFQ